MRLMRRSRSSAATLPKHAINAAGFSDRYVSLGALKRACGARAICRDGVEAHTPGTCKGCGARLPDGKRRRSCIVTTPAGSLLQGALRRERGPKLWNQSAIKQLVSNRRRDLVDEICAQLLVILEKLDGPLFLRRWWRVRCSLGL